MTLRSGTRSRPRSSRRTARVAARRQDLRHRPRAETRDRAAAPRGRAVLTSTGKCSRCASAQASFGSMVEIQHAGGAGAGDLVHLEAVEAQQPVGLVEPVLAHQRRRLQRQPGAGVRDRAEGRVVDPAQAVRGVEPGAGRAGSPRRSAASAPTIICVLCPAGANRGALRLGLAPRRSGACSPPICAADAAARPSPAPARFRLCSVGSSMLTLSRSA